jgi:hypothetical protein
MFTHLYGGKTSQVKSLPQSTPEYKCQKSFGGSLHFQLQGMTSQQQQQQQQ